MKTNSAYDALIKTKLYIPQVATDYIARDRLIDIMDQAVERPLTLVSAPAGYGKSMLVSEWVRLRNYACAWLTLDEADSDLRQFLSYLVAAMDPFFSDTDQTLTALVTTPELPPISALSVELINALDSLGDTCVIVLDDYHRLGPRSTVHKLIEKLLEYPPPNLHLVLITRRDPPLPMVSLRAANRVIEIGARDLKFTFEEASALSARDLGHTLAEEVVSHLNAEVEGWAVGLRLALLAARHVDNPDSILTGLRGSTTQVREYLFAEVLNDAPESIRDCLLKSSILDRFCADAIEAICRPEKQSAQSRLAGDEFLSFLRRDNLFTIALDAEERWVRYHQLFQDLLQHQLQQQHTAKDIAQLHLSASDWFEGQQLVDEAISHALKAADASRAADILERNYREQLNQDRFYVLQQWLDKIPAATREQRPALLLVQGFIEFFKQHITNLDPVVERVESLLDGSNDRDLRAELKFLRGYVYFWSSPTEQCEHELEEAINLVSKDNHLVLGETEVHLNLARYMNGKQAIALEALDERAQEMHASSGLVLPRVIGTRSIIHLLAGNLNGAKFEARQMQNAAIKRKSMLNTCWGYYLEGLTDLHSMNLEAAQEKFIASCEHPYSTDARAVADALAGVALAQQLMQRPEAARATVGRLIRFASEPGDLLLMETARASEARINLLQNDIDRAAGWANSFRHPPDKFSLFIWLESPPITQLRILIAIGSKASLAQAQEMLSDIRSLSEAHRFVNQTLEIAILQSVLAERQGRSGDAIEALQQAVSMAAPGRWLRPFVELGPPMRDLLEQLDIEGIEKDFVGRVLMAIDSSFAAPSEENIPTTSATVGAPAARAQTGLATHDLTNRELDILEFLGQRLQNKEIASRLFISPHTVNYHVKHIYQKLAVGNRRQAVKKAFELGVLSEV